MKGKVLALVLTLTLLTIISIVVFALAITILVKVENTNNNRPTDVPATTPPLTTTTATPPNFDLFVGGQFTDEQWQWKSTYANPWSPDFKSVSQDYAANITNALKASRSDSAYDHSQVSVNGLSGQYIENGNTAIRVSFVVGVNNGLVDSNVADDLEKGAEMLGYPWRNINAMNASELPPLPESDNSPGYTLAAQMFLNSINLSVDPCQNFFNFACDKYIATHPLGNAPRQSTFDVLQTQIYANMTKVLENFDTTTQKSETLKLVGNLYKACTAVTNTTYQGPDFVLDITKEYGGWPILDPNWNVTNLTHDIYYIIGDMFTRFGVPTLFVPSVEINWKNVTGDQTLFLDQASLTIPADYYRNPNLTQNSLDMLNDTIYQTVMQLNKDLDAQSVQDQVSSMVAIEYHLALFSVNSSQQRNMSLGWNLYTIEQAEQQFPNFNWTSFFTGALQSVTKQEPAQLVEPFSIVEPRNYVYDLNTFLSYVNAEPEKMKDLVNYLIFRLITPFMQFAGPESASIFENLRRLTRLDEPDITEQQSKCVDYLAQNIAWGAGRIYVDNNFPAQNRDDVSVMINNVLSAFSSSLSGLQWMDNESALKAFNKVAGLVRNVAYPDFEQNDQQLDQFYDYLITNTKSIDPKNQYAYYEYFRQVVAFQGQLMWNKLRTPGDRYEFLMSPAIVNAWYQPERNSITFPAGILNEPFYRYDFPWAVNYGGLGVVMGHELSHGFDDQGVQYDADGTLHTWMTPHAEAGFNQMAQCVVDEYSGFCYPQACINGIATQGENIGDNGGIKAAYRAYQAYVASHGPEKRLPGMETYTMEQIFFLSFAQVWCGSYSDEALTRQLLTNPHSPGKDRVIGAIQNFPKFGEAFNCKKGDPMYPVKSCDVW